MSKERLEEIKKHRDEANNSTDEYEFEKINFYNLHVDWLIEQAERVQELEEKNKRIRQMKYYEAYEQGKFDTNMKVWYEVPKLEQQNKRYREAIEVAIHSMATSDNLGVKFALGILEQALEGEE